MTEKELLIAELMKVIGTMSDEDIRRVADFTAGIAYATAKREKTADGE